MDDQTTLKVISTSFEDHGFMPKKHTGFGEDVSPALRILNLSPHAVSIAITMDDLDVPVPKGLNHWLIWNIPSCEEIPENIPYGPSVPVLGSAKQGIGYGKNRYRGPKQPIFIRDVHRYVFTVYALDCFLELGSSARKPALIEAMNGHVLQQGSITGLYKR